MSQTIRYRIAARTEAAGKYNPDAPQEGNEDNYGLVCDIAKPSHQPGFDEVVDLGEMGLLMFVADGMGGHNAGEVASKIAVDTVSEAFSDGKVSSGIAVSHEARSLYMEGVIREADKRIRAYSKQNKECEGMGSTLIIAWLAGDELSVSWCGDSRCYLYRPQPEPRVAMVSEDHSYVQELVQRGVIPYEATFAHPRGNVVTRCLGGGGELADPESRLAHVGKGDIILLCSDGLSGVLFDDGRLFDGQPISEENICDIITAHRSSLRECLQELFAAAERQNWYDNVTAIACEVSDGPKAPAEMPVYSARNPEPPMRKRKWPWMAGAAALSLAIVGGLVWWYLSSRTTCDASCDVTKQFTRDANTGSLMINDTAQEYHIILYDSTATHVICDTMIQNDGRFSLPNSLEQGKKYYISATRSGCSPCTIRRRSFTHTKGATKRSKGVRKAANPVPSASKAADNKPSRESKKEEPGIETPKPPTPAVLTPVTTKKLTPYNPPASTEEGEDNSNKQ